MPIQSKNPATEEIIKNYEELSKEALEEKISIAHKAYLSWREVSFSERAKLMHAHAKYLRDHIEELAVLASIEMGKTKTAAKGELEKCALVCDYYADNAEQMLSNQKIDGDAKENYKEKYVSFEPLGVVLAVMPWNFPYWQVYRFAAPALMAVSDTLATDKPWPLMPVWPVWPTMSSSRPLPTSLKLSCVPLPVQAVPAVQEAQTTSPLGKVLVWSASKFGSKLR